MEIAEMMFNFFGFDLLSESATFIDLLVYTLKIGVGLWVVTFIIRSIFIVIRTPDIRF